jgi:hypothetical protein
MSQTECKDADGVPRAPVSQRSSGEGPLPTSSEDVTRTEPAGTPAVDWTAYDNDLVLLDL